MKVRTQLSRIISSHLSELNEWENDRVEYYKMVANSYSELENSIAVLSDMARGKSYVYYGGFARTLGLDRKAPQSVDTIWEDDILGRVHPDDLERKYLGELHFFRFLKRQPRRFRSAFSLHAVIRMRTSTGIYLPVLHRLFYLYSSDRLRLALCLYNAAVATDGYTCRIVDSRTGQVTELGESVPDDLLSERERQILQLVDRGLMSKDIAQMLSISVNTVSRHRQGILRKLNVRSSIEACRIAKELNLL